MKKLYRSRSNRWVAGVAGGLGEYLGIDPTLIRLLWIVLLIPGGLPGLLPYIICWIIIPREPETAALPVAPTTAHLAGSPVAAPPAALPIGASASNGESARDA